MSAFGAYSMSLLHFFRPRHQRSPQAVLTSDQPAHADRSPLNPSPLSQLPVEIWYQIYGYLNSIDILLVAKTCHLLRQVAILRTRNSKFEGPEGVEWYRYERYRRRNPCYNFEQFADAGWSWYKRLLRKDQCYKFMEQQRFSNASDDMVICGSCLAPHPEQWFTEKELSKADPFERVCRARVEKIDLCEHKRVLYASLEGISAAREEFSQGWICQILLTFNTLQWLWERLSDLQRDPHEREEIVLQSRKRLHRPHTNHHTLLFRQQDLQ